MRKFVLLCLIVIECVHLQAPSQSPDSTPGLKLIDAADEGTGLGSRPVRPAEARYLSKKKRKQAIQMQMSLTEDRYVKTNCDMRFIEAFIYRETPKDTSVIEFKTPNPYCPRIKRSCCSDADISDFILSFQMTIGTIKSMFLGMYNVFKLYAGQERDIRAYIDSMDYKDIECAGITQEEAVKLLNEVIYFRDYKYDSVVRYLKYQLEYHSGLACTICDADYHEYFKMEDKATFVMSGSQCVELIQEKFNFLSIELSIIKLIRLVKVLQCVIVKAPTLFYKNLKTEHDVNYEDIRDCYTELGGREFEINEKCALVCKNLGHLNIIKNQDNTFKLVSEARNFFDNIMFKEASILKGKDIDISRLSTKIYNHTPQAAVTMDDYNLVIDNRIGIYPHYSKMNLNFDIQGGQPTYGIYALLAAVSLLFSK